MNLIEPTNLFDDIQLSVRFSDVPQEQAGAQFVCGDCALFDDIQALSEVVAQKAGVTVDEPLAAHGNPAVSSTSVQVDGADGVASETGYARAPTLRCRNGRVARVTSHRAGACGRIQPDKLMLAYSPHAGLISGGVFLCPRFSYPSGRGPPPLSHRSSLKAGL